MAGMGSKKNPGRISSNAGIRKLCLNMVEAANVGIWALNAQRRILFVNACMAEMLGLEADVIVGHPVTQFMFSEDLPFHENRMALHDRGEWGAYEQRLRRADGSEIWCLISETAWMDDNDQFTGSFGFLTELSDRYKMQHPLWDIDANLRTFLEAIPDPAYILDAQSRIILANSSCVRIFGIKPEQICGYPILDNLSVEYAKVYQKQLEEAIHQREAHIFEYPMGERIIRFYLFPIPGGDGTFSSVAVIQMDITEQKLAEHRLSKNEARLASLVRLNQLNEKPIQDLMDFGLEEAIRLTGSEVGYIYFYNEEKHLFSLYSWSNSAMQQCSIVEKQTIYVLEKTGIWGEAVRQRRPILINDFNAPHPAKKGYPEGHVQLHRYLTLPIFQRNEIVAVIGVGNKISEYTEEDIEQLQLFMDGLWNITQRKRMEETLVYQSMHDTLTGLYNRAYFETALTQLESSRQYPISIVMADVNGLKAINDICGHATGDELLRATAYVLSQAFRSEDIIARIGGDEFAVLLPKTQRETAAEILDRLNDFIALYNQTDNNVVLSLSFGFSTGEAGCSLTELLKQADDLMYQEKTRKRQTLAGIRSNRMHL